MVSLVNSHTNATRIGWHLWEIDLRFAPGLPPGWRTRVFVAATMALGLLAMTATFYALPGLISDYE